ncbi:OmpA family protein [Sneathiella marina]|uniref:OmpA family protein n=1 Tax=Sneathiella marina TaxID=2950108 RepID=A0ABY4WDH8_9PROT|nr:OmpA family protein [Sneathiella marina]USG62681.1 OmpA family protein [Sneathiella marina]
MKNNAENARHLLNTFILTLSLTGASAAIAVAAQPIVISSTSTSNVQVNLPAPKSETKYTAPQRIIDGSNVIILVPPSLQKKAPEPRVVTPRVKPELSLPETAASKPAGTAAETTAIPVPPVNPAKLPPTETAEAAPGAGAPEKFDTVPENTALASGSSQPNAAEAAAVKQDVVSEAVAKVAPLTETGTPKETAPLQPQAGTDDAQPQAEETSPAPQKSNNVEAPTEPPKEKEIVVAALPPEQKPDPAPITRATGDMTRILFPAGEAALPVSAEAEIQAIADQLQNEGQNVQLIAYATGDSNSAARRLSLGRALSVRSKLMDLGVKNNKIEVRALGQPTGDGPVDRVDLVMIAR